MEDNFDVKILDAYVEGFEEEVDQGEFTRIGISWDAIKKIIEEYDPQFVGVSGMFDTQDRSVAQTLKLIREVNPDIKTFIGGPYPTYNVEKVLNSTDIDYVILHEAEFTVRELLNKLLNKEDISDIGGVGYRQDGEIKINKKIKFIENLDDLPMPARHLLPMEKYFQYNLGQSFFSIVV